MTHSAQPTTPAAAPTTSERAILAAPRELCDMYEFRDGDGGCRVRMMRDGTFVVDGVRISLKSGRVVP